MTGTLINTGAVSLGSAAGISFSKSLRPHIEVRLRMLLGVLVIYVGFSTTVKSLGKTGLSHIRKELAIVFLSLTVRNALGMLLYLQDGMNKIGQYANRVLT